MAVFVVFALVVALVGLSVWLLMASLRPPKDCPPGPGRIPILGSSLSFNFSKPFGPQYWALSKKYGSIFSMRLGQMETVVLCDPADMREVFSKDEASGRPSLMVIDILFLKNQNVGIIGSSGEAWRQIRRFSIKTLRDFGFGRKVMEDRILDEIKELIAGIRPSGGPSEQASVINLRIPLAAAVANAILQILAGKRVSADDEEFKKVVEAMGLEHFQLAAVLSFFPQLAKWIPGWVYGRKGLEESSDLLHTFIAKRLIADHAITLTPGEPRDFVDCYLEEKMRLDQEGKPHYFTDFTLATTLLDLFGAGFETTTTTLCWFFLYMVKYPEIQRRIQDQIDANVGQDRIPTWTDRENLPYLEATINEVWRLPTIAPQGVTHLAMADFEIRGYKISQGTTIIGNLWASHMNPAYWEEPEKFMPERHLDEAGKFKKSDALLPFQIGKRMCLGENLARMETFMTAAALLQLFNFEQVPGDDYSTTPNPKNVFINEPQHFRVKLLPRSSVQ